MEQIKYFEELFQVFKYPYGEPHVRLINWQDLPFHSYKIICSAKDWNDLAILWLAHDLLDMEQIEHYFVIPYLPFARHDRMMDRNDSRPMELVREMLHDLPIMIIDPHSEVAAQLQNYPQSEVVKFFAAYGLWDDNPIVAIPDAGAAKKAYSWLPKDTDSVQCLKKRNTADGKLSGFTVVDPDGLLAAKRPVLIVDDICDGGGTFIGLANAISEVSDTSNFHLAVSHGLFTKGLEPLLAAGFNKIYTFDNCPIDNIYLKKASLKIFVKEGKAF